MNNLDKTTKDFIKYLKNDYYKYYTTSQAVNITKIYAIFNLTTPVVKYGEDVIIELVNSPTASGLLSLNYTYVLNGETLTRQINSTVVNGVSVFKFDDDAIDLIAKEDKISKAIHLPVQSGNDEVLFRMNRHYNIKHYNKLIVCRQKMS